MFKVSETGGEVIVDRWVVLQVLIYLDLIGSWRGSFYRVGDWLIEERRTGWWVVNHESGHGTYGPYSTISGLKRALRKHVADVESE